MNSSKFEREKINGARKLADISHSTCWYLAEPYVQKYISGSSSPPKETKKKYSRHGQFKERMKTTNFIGLCTLLIEKFDFNVIVMPVFIDLIPAQDQYMKRHNGNLWMLTHSRF